MITISYIMLEKAFLTFLLLGACLGIIVDRAVGSFLRWAIRRSENAAAVSKLSSGAMVQGELR